MVHILILANARNIPNIPSKRQGIAMGMMVGGHCESANLYITYSGPKGYS